MSNVLRWITTIALVAAGLSVVTAAPAAAAACGTGGTLCTGWDPQSAGCSPGAYNLESFDHGGDGITDLRYNATCHAAWARFTSSSGRGGKISIESTDGIEYVVNLAGYVGEVKWTRMIDFTKTVRACHFAYYGDQALWKCSSWR
ncbi:DUF2690 domain-containing protein [Actinoplanes sp. NBRC 103695]|uniref:DUF2690 domain-containing protein n=1 Tax=Actinoplanes sp. NBRC 103695 TaxID=3032202 RepID=UPI0024A5A33F|nr:DUF2690 domain-containing protein [Actinoplanes sp. NBRC 103695]GLZ00957.1 hypothetical protein Acsp02_82090 [Actinoplanes sp. NBRC 103695]